MRDRKALGQAAMGRPREFDPETALAKILDVFWSKGFEGATMRDLVDATGLKKGSLYAAFGDKRAMYLKALALYDRTAIDHAVVILSGSGPVRKRIEGFLLLAISPVNDRKDRRGCFLCNASVDQAVLDSETGRAVKKCLDRLGHALEGAFTKKSEKTSKQNTTNKKFQAQAQYILSVYFGLRVLAKGGHSAKTLLDIKGAALRAIA